MIPEANTSRHIALPDIPALLINAKSAHLLTADGELQTLPIDQAKSLLHKKPVLVCHAPYIRGRLGHDADFYAFDLLELYAFVHPARFATPTINGLCHTLGLVAPESFEDAPMVMMDIARALLSDLRDDPHKAKADPLEIARVMGLNGKGWGWTPFIFNALGAQYDPAVPIISKTGLNVWKDLPEWSEQPPPPPPSHHPVTPDETRDRLAKLRGHGAEQRQAQEDYALSIAHIFDPPSAAPAPPSNIIDLQTQTTREAAPPDTPEDNTSSIPNIALVEAGTGVGKTLGYLAPASIWAEKNEGSVWISTYTKNLQRQIDQELDRLYPDNQIKTAHIATRKGRENYLCLLNLEETANGAALAKHNTAAIASGIMARWVVASKDGDLTGGQYPGWLTHILGYQHSLGLADRRGECVYSACDHYSKCFIEHSVRAAKSARIVVANHALVMINAAMANAGDDMPTRYIFDEGHHLFDAADSAYAAHLTARETRDLRRWILGNEGGVGGSGARSASRARGLKRRAEDLTEGMQDAEEHLRKILRAAEALTMDGWTRRLKDGHPSGPAETFMAALYAQIFARAQGRDGPYSLETQVFPVDNPVAQAAMQLKSALVSLQKPMLDLAQLFYKKIHDDVEGHLNSDTRKRLESIAQGLERRARMTLQAWIEMLDNLGKDPMANNTPPNEQSFVDWLEIERIDGKAIDVGYYRHFIDPMKPFATSMRPHIHGLAVTSATLRESEAWDGAINRTGAAHLTHNITQGSHADEALKTASFQSPFNYAKQTKVFIIDDVRKDDLRQVAAAYQSLFNAADGSALGLFTAISRLRAVHNVIASPLEDAGIPLYAQHVDDIDIGTLVDMFREDERSCLLGTDAIRDGVDVPGDALRLIAFDRVPWPRPTILHKERRNHFGGRKYDEMITRLKLKQAFGRLIRRADDKGVFVMIDPMLPSRLHDAFPADVEIVKTGLSDVVTAIQDFL